MEGHAHGFRWWALILVASVAVGPARAQAPGEAVVAAVRAALQQFAYAEAEQQARAALAEPERFSLDQLTELHALLGQVAYAQGEEVEARRQFEAALSLNPHLTLDPLLVSPKIIAFFEEVKRTWTPPEAGASPTEAPPRYVVVPDPRPAAALRSMLVPGWGQLYKGERRKGRWLLGAWVGTAGATAAAHLARARAEDAYLAAREPDRIADRYQRFDRWHKLRNNLALAAAGVWVVSYVDALVAPGDGPAFRRRLDLYVVPDASGWQGGLRWRLP